MICQSYILRDNIYLNNLKVLNIFVMVISVFILFIGYDLLHNYAMDIRFLSILSPDLWPIYILPLVFLCVGSATLFTSSACFICSIFHSKCSVMCYAILMVVLVLGKFVCLFLTFKAQGLIEYKLIDISETENNFNLESLYYKDKTFQSHWDNLQNRFRCCGAKTYEDFYINNTYEFFPSSCNINVDFKSKNETAVNKVKSKSLISLLIRAILLLNAIV